MKQSLALLLILPVLLLATACASAPATETATHEADVRETMSGFMEALNALDVERMAAFFADDITAFVPLSHADRVNGKAAAVEVFRKYVEITRKTTARTQLVPEDLRVDTGDDMAVVTFNIRTAGPVLRRTFIFRNQGGRWLIVHFHASNFKLPDS